MGLEFIIKGVVFGAKVFRIFRSKKIVAKVRSRAAVGLFTLMHTRVLHSMRRLSIQMTDWDTEQDAAAHIAADICTSCRDLMANMLELKPNELHCCLKLVAPQANPADEGRVATWARSNPFDDRPVEQGDENAHAISKNSVWSALYGKSDGTTHWRPFSCFGCNDLHKHADLFVCDRKDWQRYYRSTLVFPLRYAKNKQATEFKNIGFIAFDSPLAGVFLGIPDIFEHREKLTQFQDKLEDCTIFHMGAIFADTLSTFLRRIYQERESHGEINGKNEHSQ